MVEIFLRRGVGRLKSKMQRVGFVLFLFEDNSLLGVGEEEAKEVGNGSPNLNGLFAQLLALFFFRGLSFSLALKKMLVSRFTLC